MSILKQLVAKVAAAKAKEIDHMLDNPVEVTNAKLMSILTRHSDTVYGKQHGFSSIRSAEEFSRKVPLVDSHALQPYLERIYADPSGKILTTDPVVWYLQSSGTTGKPKRMPTTKIGLKDSSKGSAMTWMSFINAGRENANILDGTLVTFGAAAVLDHVNSVPVGYATGVYARHQNKIFQRLIKPGEDVFNIQDMDKKMEAYARILATENVTGLQGITPLSLALIRRMQDQYGPWLVDILGDTPAGDRIRRAMDGDGRLDVGQLWPNLRLFLASGIDTTAYRKWITATFPNIQIVDMYGASEGVFAGQLLSAERGMQLFTNTHYFEFIPEEYSDDTTPEVVPLSDVKKGHRYEIVITNIQGYYRYRPGDMVTVASTDPYSIRSVSRRGRVVNLSGEKISEAHVSAAMGSACAKTGAEVVDYTVLGTVENGLGHYTIAALFRETDVNVVDFVLAFEESMKTVSDEFRVVRETGALGPTVLRKLRASHFEEIVRRNHLQAKPVALTTDASVLSMCEA